MKTRSTISKYATSLVKLENVVQHNEIETQSVFKANIYLHYNLRMQ